MKRGDILKRATRPPSRVEPLTDAELLDRHKNHTALTFDERVRQQRLRSERRKVKAQYQWVRVKL